MMGDITNIEQCKLEVKFGLKPVTIKYTFDNIYEATEACFKLAHGLNCHYPEESELAWTFVERFVFGLKISRTEPQVETLVNQCNLHIKRSAKQ